MITSTPVPDDSWIIAYENVSLSGAVSINEPVAIAQYGTGSKNLQFNGSGISTAAATSISFFGNDSVNSKIRINTSLDGSATISVADAFLQLDGANTYTGSTTVNGGAVVSVESASGLGNASGNTNVLSGGSLSFAGASAMTIAEPLNIIGTGTAANNGAIYADTAGDTTLTGTIVLSGDATIRNIHKGYTLEMSGIISGSGNLTLVGVWDSLSGAYVRIDGSAPNTYTGTTLVNGGSVYFRKAGAIPGNLSIDNEDPGVNRSRAFFYDSSDVMSNTGVLTQSSDPNNMVTFGENNEVIGGLQGAGGEIKIQSSDDKVIIDQNFDSTYDGTFYTDGSLGTIEKRGTGSLTLTNTYQFIADQITFAVTAGTLVVNGDVRTTTGGNVVVSGGILKGKGTVRDVTFSGGTIAPGNSPGTLNVTTLTLNASSVYQQEIASGVAGTGYDQVIATGAVSLGNAVLSIIPTYTPANNTVFTIITSSAVTGTFNGLANGSETTVNGLRFRVNYTASAVTLTYLAGSLSVVPGAPNTGAQPQSNTLAYVTIVVGLLFVASYAIIRRRYNGTKNQ